ncbi:hypothetical protein [Labrenzia sp. R5_0]|uniref:hypothetical protein n=1 Tax=Labrenzia sp. R5_0 TaxID=2821108 RepID=UPI001ADB6C4B|nr:hypothetical protein [Labrenzia sp. R5_0]MBO9460675.1 hypothetical protein [Labrenzia sp. R5_0]
MRIACLGWGSLIWDPRSLPVVSDWSHDGPSLPVEFTRQSSDGRITLVITPSAKAVKVLSAVLEMPSIETACAALAEREGIPGKFVDRSVGYWIAESRSHHPEADIVARWAEQAGYEGAVWTALKPKFDNAYVAPPCERVVSYLDSLAGEARDRAENYVRRTPAVIRTEYRMAIEKALAWTPAPDA